MKKTIAITVSAIVMLCVCMSSCVTRVDAGHEGIKVNLAGSNKGVDQEVHPCTGWCWYNPFTERIYEYPTFIQTVDYPEFTLNTKDGSQFVVDPTILIKLQPNKASEVFVRYRKDMSVVITDVLEQFVRNAYRVELNKYTADELISNREAFENSVETRLHQVLGDENFELIEITSGLKYPESLLASIEAKVKIEQDRLRTEQEVAVARAEAEKLLVKANAEAEANRIRSQSLTPQVLQQEWLKKWNGTVPAVVGSNTSTFVDISKIGK